MGLPLLYFSVSMALCESGAYLHSIAALPPLRPQEGSYSFITPILMKLAESARACVRRG